MAVSAWEALFMLVVLKIPMVYLAAVVWWAIRAEPLPGTEDESLAVPAPVRPCGWHDWRRRFVASRRGLRPRPSGDRLRTAGGVRPAPTGSARR
ncbi:MAG TPA: hypothetical protein VMN35_03350 [Gaiellaceae bacterium]|nr:hypothetical protein [Gaiellaceae bacterium]